MFSTLDYPQQQLLCMTTSPETTEEFGIMFYDMLLLLLLLWFDVYLRTPIDLRTLLVAPPS